VTYNLFLDDKRDIHDVKWVDYGNLINEPWIIVRSFDEFVQTVEKLGIPLNVSFDHDLNYNHYQGDYSDGKTGKECAIYLLKKLDERASNGSPRARGRLFVHSLNEEAPRRILIEAARDYENSKIKFVKDSGYMRIREIYDDKS
jgi:hypothetical protein